MPSLALTPRRHLLFIGAADDSQPPAVLWRTLEGAFERGSGHGLLELGAGEVGTALPTDFSYWRDFGARFVTAICTHPDLHAQERMRKANGRRPARRDLTNHRVARIDAWRERVIDDLWRIGGLGARTPRVRGRMW